MSGHFEKGVFVEDKTLEELRQAVLNATMAYHEKLCEFDGKTYGYSWAETATGVLVIVSTNPAYSERLKKIILRMK